MRLPRNHGGHRDNVPRRPSRSFLQHESEDASRGDLSPRSIPVASTPFRGTRSRPPEKKPSKKNVSKFLFSALESHQLPPELLPEVAFWGTSNVGKSSLINILLGQISARVSKQPGRTQSLNFYRHSPGVLLVDAPGYGYAKVPKKLKNRWDLCVGNFFRSRSTLRHTFLLIDARHDPSPDDISAIDFLMDANRGFSLVLTKIDAISSEILRDRCANIQKLLQDKNPRLTCIVTPEHAITKDEKNNLAMGSARANIPENAQEHAGAEPLLQPDSNEKDALAPRQESANLLCVKNLDDEESIKKAPSSVCWPLTSSSNPEFFPESVALTPPSTPLTPIPLTSCYSLQTVVPIWLTSAHKSKGAQELNAALNRIFSTHFPPSSAIENPFRRPKAQEIQTDQNLKRGPRHLKPLGRRGEKRHIIAPQAPSAEVATPGSLTRQRIADHIFRRLDKRRKRSQAPSNSAYVSKKAHSIGKSRERQKSNYEGQQKNTSDLSFAASQKKKT